MYYATEKQMEKLDLLAVRYGLEIRQMMELAGWHMLNVFSELKISKKEKITVVVGKGNKGGDGLCAARHLINNGWKVTVILLAKKISDDSLHQLKLLKKMKADILLYSKAKRESLKRIKESTILIDALIGYHLQGVPRGLFKELIEAMNRSKNKIIAYDLPSGLDATTGKCLKPCIRAWATLTLALPKRAFITKEGGTASGKIFLGDIGIPDFLYNKIRQNSRPQFRATAKNLLRI